MKKKRVDENKKVEPENVGAVYIHTGILENEKKTNKTKKPINKKVIIPISVLLVIVLIGTVLVLTLKSKQENEKILADGQEQAGIQENKEETKSVITLQDNEYMHVETDASGDQVPVPNGYVGSKATRENEIDSGYVIYEGTEEVNDSNVADAQKNRNQYVWVPVPDTSKFYGTDANGKKWGKLYNFSATRTSSDTDPVTGAYPEDWSETNGVMHPSTRDREPAVLTRSDRDYILKKLGLGATSMHEFLMQMEQEFNRMIASVEKYGGFYIGRYETGNINQETPVVRKGNSSISSVAWYNSYKRCKNLRGSNTNVETGIIWGNQWDRTLMWLVESGNKTKEEICKDSTSWGNYSNSTEPGAGSKRPTGYSETWKANNIYDLAGNVNDLTMEASEIGVGGPISGRYSRGGYFGSDGDFGPAQVRYTRYGPTDSNNYIGARGALYIK